MTLEANEFSPTWAAAPGITIARALTERGMSYEQLADSLQLSKRFVTNLISGSEEITTELAEALAEKVGSTKRFWLAREREYRESLNRLANLNPDLGEWTASLPLQDMHRFGWIRDTTGAEVVAECLRFFGVSSLERWKQAFESAVIAAAFRSSAAFDMDTGSLSVWLRRGELEAAAVKCATWDPKKFKNCLPEIRKLTRLKSPSQFMPELRRLCSASGVAVVVVAAPAGCRASGAARFVSKSRALIQLSQRYGTDDQFWFTFFHEAGHLLLHPKTDLFVDDVDSNDSREENEANEFASKSLLSESQSAKLSQLPITYRDVIRFAREVGLSPGIIVGQLQHSKRIKYQWLNKAKRKFDWNELQD